MVRTNKDKTNKKKGGVARKTRKHYKKSNKTNSHIVKVFLEVLNMVKLYHWKTHSYAHHQATDELYANFKKLF